MAEQTKGRKCSDCSYWKVRESPCTYYDQIQQGIVLKTDQACGDFRPRQKAKKSLNCTRPMVTQSKAILRPSIIRENQPF